MALVDHRMVAWGLISGRAFTTRRPQIVRAAAESSDDIGTAGIAAVGLGALANPLVLPVSIITCMCKFEIQQ